MFLKRMETIGFKSFADRIQIEFMPGITAIVGPNGSGKSNVIDAIRWVLGEQSARSLRGQKMEDIIFQGSETRDRLNFAEVSLIFNNEQGHLPIDYQEVSITRRVYRSGESEFYINKQPCRLKDIIDLFTDTGLGRESFSIIGQGKIDEILSSKAEERRAVFEEAAGVMKYKQRKQQATNKLAETEDNLSRVDDIIYELNQQLTPLKEQAEVAKQYQALKNELKEKEIALLITEIEQLHENWQSILQTIATEKEKAMAELTALQAEEAKLIKERETVELYDRQLNELQQALLTTTEQLEQTEGKRSLLLERMKHREANKQQLLAQKAHVSRELNEVSAALEQETTHHQEIIVTIDQLESEKAKVEERLFNLATTLEEEIENLKADYIEWLNQQAVLQNERTTIEQQISQHEALLTKSRNEHEAVVEKLAACQDKLTQTNQAIAQLKTAMTKKEQELTDTKQTIVQAAQTVEQLEKRVRTRQEQLVKLTSRYDALQEMKENFQGFAYGVRQILQAKKQGIVKNIIGTVIDLIKVPNEYMTAMETILGQQAQYIVVPNEKVARDTIAWLKRENKGRATFLPLDVIVTRHVPEHIYTNIQHHPGVIGIASELVDIAPEYKRVIEHLMGNVIVTQTLQDASEIAQLTQRKFRIVTLDGDVVFPGGSMSGGAQKKANYSLFTREKELAQLSEQITELTAQVERERKQILQHQADYQKLNEKRMNKESELNELDSQLQTHLAKQKELEIQKVNIENELASYDYYVQQYEDENQHLRDKLAKIKAELTDVQAKLQETESAIHTKTIEQKQLSANEKQYQDQLHELELKLAEQRERKRNSNEKIIALQERLTQIQQEERSLVEQLEEIYADEQVNANTDEIDGQIASLSTQKTHLQAEINELRTKREKLQQWISDAEKELKTKQKLHEQFAHTIQEKEIEANRLDVMLDNRLNKLQAEYVITYEKAQEKYEKVADVRAANDEVNRLKKAIEALGTVNLGAIEEYDRLTERLAFLHEQKEDLLTAKQTLYEAIREMDQEMIRRFKATFTKIHAAFTEVFKELFGGGHAELMLTDPDNYLETGVDIVARPPGKKLKTLELLSGGERALTAIALLFAILKARPVPFVILDEVDAALDEANVDRFASYLKSFSAESQFIVISHRKGTMEEADALYGVTMQESGVSRFVSVKLEEADELMNVTS